MQLYLDQGIVEAFDPDVLCIVNPDHNIDPVSECSIKEHHCIFLQLYGGDMKKKKKCCKNYKKEKRCKKCPD